jgi:hypothetical protein
MRTKTNWIVCTALGIAAIAAGCGDGARDATQAAIDAAQQAVNAVKEDAEKYVPEELHKADDALQSARDALAKSDYHGALAAAREAADKAKQMAADAIGKKDEWEKSWNDLNNSIPSALDQVKRRADLYSAKGVRLPEGVDKDIVDSVKEQCDKLKQDWADAKAEAAKGNLKEAIEKGTGVKELIEKLRETLKMKTA